MVPTPPRPVHRRSLAGMGWLPLAVLPLAFGCCIIGCGSQTADEGSQQSAATGETQPAPPATNPARRGPRGPAPHAEDFGVVIKGTVHTLPGHAPSLPAWGDDLRRRIEAAGDDSLQEKLAVNLESTCAQLFQGLMAGFPQSKLPALPKDFAGFTGLPGDLSQLRFEDGSFRVFDGVLNKQTLDAAALSQHWNTDGWKNTHTTASVVGIARGKPDGWLCDVELRIVGELQATPAMLDMDLQISLASNGAQDATPQVTAILAKSQRLILRHTDAFQAITGDTFGSLENWGRELGLGNEDYLRVRDRRQIPSGTGILGMALGDVDGDGLEDIYLCQAGGFPNRLLLHQPDGSVIDGAQAAGVDILDTTRGALLVDLDGDGDLDLSVSREARIALFWNDGKGHFSPAQLLEGEGNAPIYSLSAADPDRDGDLDLYAVRYPVGAGEEGVPTPYHNATNGAHDLYWQNEGNGKFILANDEVGLNDNTPRYGFVSLWDDFTGDGQIDLYVVNDFGPNNLFVIEDGKFVDRAAELGLLDQAAGMGITVADVEMDGDLDAFVTNMYSAPGLRATAEDTYRPGEDEVRGSHRRMAAGNSLLLQNGPGSYTETGKRSGVDHGGWAWGAVFYDWNLDGLPDLYVPNGFITADNETDVESLFWRWIVRVTPPPTQAMETYFRNWGALSFFNQIEGYSYNGHERNHVYLNMGNAEFADISPLSEIDFLDDGRVASRVDWDGDGYEDLLLVNRTGPRLRLIRNKQGQGAHRIVLQLSGKNGSAGAVGARVQVTRGDGKLVTRTLYAGEGLLGQSSTKLFFGLGSTDKPVDVSIRWPDGEEQTLVGLDIDRGWNIHQDGTQTPWPFTNSPFDSKPPTPVVANPLGVQRCVLAAPMPLRSLELRRPGGQTQRIGDLGNSPKLLVLWHPDSRSGEAFLRQLAAVTDRLSRTGTLLVPVALEGETDGKALLEQLGLGQNALNANRTDRLVFEALLMEVLNTYDPIDLPLTFLLDEQSELCALYYGEIQSEAVLKDLRRLRKRPAGSDPTLALSGGFWLGQPKRRYNQIIRPLMMLGARALATDLKRSR